MSDEPNAAALRRPDHADVVDLTATLSVLPVFTGTGSFAVGTGFYEHVTKPEAEAEFAARCGSHPDFVPLTNQTYPDAFEANARLALNVQMYKSLDGKTQYDGVARLAAGGAISDIMSAKFRQSFPSISGLKRIKQAERELIALSGAYNVEDDWAFAPQFTVTSLAHPDSLSPLTSTSRIIPFAEARGVEVWHAPLRTPKEWVGSIPIPRINQYYGRYWLVGKLVSKAVVFTKDGVHYPLPRWLSFGGIDYEFPFACTIRAYNPPAL